MSAITWAQTTVRRIYIVTHMVQQHSLQYDSFNCPCVKRILQLSVITAFLAFAKVCCQYNADFVCTFGFNSVWALLKTKDAGNQRDLETGYRII